jgi:glycosyltransferase involved in cell wall biosynthesis
LKKQRIAINALSATIGGGVTYLQNLVPGLVELDKEHEYYLFAAEENYQNIFGPVRFNGDIKIVRIKTYNLFVRMLQEQLLLPLLVLKYRIDLLICPANILTFLAPCRKILGILNIYMYFELKIEGEPLFERFRFHLLRFLTSLSIRLSPLTIHISDFSRDHLAGMLGVGREKAYTVYLGAKLDAFARPKDFVPTKDKYILSVSSISKRKNYDVLVKAFAKLAPDLRRDYRLVLVGSISPEMKDHLLGLVAEPLREKIDFRGNATFQELCAAYKQASLFVLPSLVEAFGIPIVEAMAAGVPVLVSNTTALPEIAGAAGLTFDPYDPAALARLMEKVLTDPGLAERMSWQGIERSAMFTWENTAKQTLACINRVLIK